MNIVPSSGSLKVMAGRFAKLSDLMKGKFFLFQSKNWFCVMEISAYIFSFALLIYGAVKGGAYGFALAFNAVCILIGGPVAIWGFLVLAAHWCMFASRSDKHFKGLTAGCLLVILYFVHNPIAIVAMPSVIFIVGYPYKLYKDHQRRSA